MTAATQHDTQDSTEPRDYYAMRKRAERTNDLAFGAHIALKLIDESRSAEQQGDPPILDPLREEALLRMASAILDSLSDQAMDDLLALAGSRG